MKDEIKEKIKNETESLIEGILEEGIKIEDSVVIELKMER